MKTLGIILWTPGGVGILLWMAVKDGTHWLAIPALFLTPFALANIFVLYIAGLVKKIKAR